MPVEQAAAPGAVAVVQPVQMDPVKLAVLRKRRTRPGAAAEPPMVLSGQIQLLTLAVGAVTPAREPAPAAQAEAALAVRAIPALAAAEGVVAELTAAPGATAVRVETITISAVEAVALVLVEAALTALAVQEETLAVGAEALGKTLAALEATVTAASA